MTGGHSHSSGAASGAQASAGAALRAPRRMALVDPACRRLVARAAAAQELRRLGVEDDHELGVRLERVLAGVGLAGLNVTARWGSLTSTHGPGTLGMFTPARGQRRALITLEQSMLVRGGWSVDGVTIDPTERVGFGRLLNDLIAHEVAHLVAHLRTRNEDARHGEAFAAAAAELHERSPRRLPPAAAPWLEAWPQAQRADAYYGEAAPRMSSIEARYLERLRDREAEA